jgi:acetate kinase
MIEELSRLSPFDPEHLPEEIMLIEAVRRRFPDLPQVACFDTAFHHALPRVARLLPIPRRYEAQGVRRYGFHGLSYEFLTGELARVAGPAELSSPISAMARVWRRCVTASRWTQAWGSPRLPGFR